MKKQNENHQYNLETKTTHIIRNMITYTEQLVTRMTVQHTHQKRMRNIIQDHQQIITKKKKQDEQLEMLKEQTYLIK